MLVKRDHRILNIHYIAIASTFGTHPDGDSQFNISYGWNAHSFLGLIPDRQTAAQET